MDKFLGKYKSPKLIQEEIDSFKSPIGINEFESVNSDVIFSPNHEQRKSKCLDKIF